jgi:hypothetical protein
MKVKTRIANTGVDELSMPSMGLCCATHARILSASDSMLDATSADFSNR